MEPDNRNVNRPGGSLANRLFIALIGLYRSYLSPLLGPSCRFYPTCSQYALEAYRHHNFFKATWLSVWRVLRCNPFSRGGYDPVPREESANSRKL